jgi:hypothetical protein
VRPTRRARLALRSRLLRRDGRPVAHFIHVEKAGGTAIKAALRAAGDDRAAYHVVRHTHGVRMQDLPRADCFFFVVRDPLERFVSGFLDRQRCGRPRYDRPWTSEEARAFARFRTPDELGRALGSDGADRVAAVEAMRTIEHVRRPLTYWLGGVDALARRLDRVLYIGVQDTLDRTVPLLAERLGLPGLVLPTDPVAANRATGGERHLSEAAVAALTAWYRDDVELVAYCRSVAPLVGGGASS